MTTTNTQQAIVKEFSGIKDWWGKYGRLIELGRTLPVLTQSERTDDKLVKGCQVKTWYSSSVSEGKVFYRIDSLSLIIRGALTLLLGVLNGRTPQEIKNLDLFFIEQADLGELFSPVKANSLWKVINRMQADAAAYGQENNK